MRGRRRRAQEGSIRDHLFEAIDCALNLAAVRDVLFDFVDEGRDRNAARVCGRIGAAAGDLLAGPERILGEHTSPIWRRKPLRSFRSWAGHQQQNLAMSQYGRKMCACYSERGGTGCRAPPSLPAPYTFTTFWIWGSLPNRSITERIHLMVARFSSGCPI